jgi:hypothetical protein
MEGFMGKLEGKRPHGKPKHKLENNVKMDLKELGRESVK